MKDKENVIQDYINMIINSWTYDRMTQLERNRLIDELNSKRLEKALKGTYNARWEVLGLLYSIYLTGLGYEDYNWREVEEVAKVVNKLLERGNVCYINNDTSKSYIIMIVDLKNDIIVLEDIKEKNINKKMIRVRKKDITEIIEN